MTSPRTRGAAAVAVTLGLLVSGCSHHDTASSAPSTSPSASASASTSSSPSGSASASATPGPSAAVTRGTAPRLSAYYGQRLSWSPCQSDFECARLKVPLSYAKPKGASIEVALLKVPARDQADKLGSLVVDPGGPGGSGVDYAASASRTFGSALLDHYDIVGLDPRGVDRSDPVDCLPDTRLNTVLTSNPAPETAAATARSDRLLEQLGDGCLRRSGPLARHMSTAAVARDLDVLRAALGQRRLDYFGASYGTAIGYTYADAFPQRVGRMVLDGALNPRSSTLGINLVQARGFETALRAYVADCVDRGSCFLGSSVEQGTERVKAFLDQVEQTPIQVGDRVVNLANASYGISYPLYDKTGWSILTTALKRAFAGDGTLLMALADGYLHRTADNTFRDNEFEAFYSVNCLDHDDAIPSSQLGQYAAEFDQASPTFGRTFLYATSACENWPVHTHRGPHRVRATGSAPIMVVGTTRDPATPLVWARSLARQLDNAVLVIRDGDGHTGYRQGSTCTDDAIESYLVEGTVPAHTVRCRQD